MSKVNKAKETLVYFRGNYKQELLDCFVLKSQIPDPEAIEELNKKLNVVGIRFLGEFPNYESLPEIIPINDKSFKVDSDLADLNDFACVVSPQSITIKGTNYSYNEVQLYFVGKDEDNFELKWLPLGNEYVSDITPVLNALKTTETTLWEIDPEPFINPASAVAQEQQQITLSDNISNYKQLKIFYMIPKPSVLSNNIIGSVTVNISSNNIVHNLQGIVFNSPSTGNHCFANRLIVQRSDNNIFIETCFLQTTNIVAWVQGNKYLQVVKIVGIN